jgi:mannitol/fructose-specific phosphotransferase system IIA component (Ntr-type)
MKSSKEILVHPVNIPVCRVRFNWLPRPVCGSGEEPGRHGRALTAQRRLLTLPVPLILTAFPHITGGFRDMELREFFSEDVVKLDLGGESKDEILKELIRLLGLDEKSEGILYKMLKRRENLGSTGIGKGIAIPHCRSLVVNRLRVAFGRKPEGVDFKAIDEQPVYNIFLIVAPPLEVSNQYLPVLGKIAQFSKDSDVVSRLEQIEKPDEFLALLEQKGT